jgi:hypothetical protein
LTTPAQLCNHNPNVPCQQQKHCLQAGVPDKYP